MNIQTIKVTSVDKVQPIKITNAQNIVLNFDLQEKEVIPTKEEQIIKADLGYDGLKQVEIKPIPSEYIKPTGTKEIIENGIHNVKEFENVDVNVIYQTNYQEKNIVPTKEIQEIVADENYDALEKVVVEPIPNDYVIPNGKLEITENGEYNVSNYELVKVETSGADLNEYFTETIKNSSSSSYGAFVDTIKKLPKYKNTGTSCRNMFYVYKGTEIDLSNFDTSLVTDMSSMFDNCSNLTSLDLSKLDTGNVTTMNEMFNGCRAFTSLDISTFDTKSLTDMSEMFYDCTNLQSLYVANLDTSKVSNMSNMFYNCSKLKNLDLSTWKPSSITNLSYMFNYCSVLTNLDLSGFDASNVININSMFASCSSLTNLNFMKNLGKAYVQKTNNYSNYRLSLSNSTKLTHDALMDIINNLYDLNLTYDVANGGVLYTQSLQIGTTNKSKLTADDIAIATAKGWTIS